MAVPANPVGGLLLDVCLHRGLGTSDASLPASAKLIRELFLFLFVDDIDDDVRVQKKGGHGGQRAVSRLNRHPVSWRSFLTQAAEPCFS